MSPRRLALAVAGVVSALAVASTPLAASADTGHLIPVRYSPKGGSTGPEASKYLAEIDAAHVVVQRRDGEVTFVVHDSAIASGQPYLVFVFNSPGKCSPAVGTAGKAVFDPEGEQVSLCDLIKYDVMHGGFAAPPKGQVSGIVSVSGEGNFILTASKANGLTNPKGAEIAVFFPVTRHIFFASPYLPDSDHGNSEHDD